MNDMSQKVTWRKNLICDWAYLVAIFGMVALMTWLFTAVYFSHERRMEYGTVEIPKGTFTWNELEEAALPDYQHLKSECTNALTYGSRGGYPYWYPEDILNACKQMLKNENTDIYNEMRDDLRAFGYIEE